MAWREMALPVPMRRVAIVSPADRVRDALVRVAGAGTVELVGAPPPLEGAEAEALRRVERAHPDRADEPPCVSAAPVDIGVLERDGARGLLAGEAEVRRRCGLARAHGGFAVLLGWMAAQDVPALVERLRALGAGVVELPRPSWVEPPTAYRPTRVRQTFRPLVSTYGVSRYGDVDVTPFAVLAFVIMFGMMFGDVGHGLVLTCLGLLLRGSGTRLRSLHVLWPFVVGCGIASMVFGLLYGEFFGPTGVVPTIWLDPIDQVEELLVAAVALGAALLTVSQAYGVVNRWREAGFRAALLAPSGIAGLAVLAGLALVAVGWYRDSRLLVAGVALILAGAVLLAVGFVASGGVFEATVELVDALVRVVSNVLSFTRLAAFGLMHAALGLVVLEAARSLGHGPLGVLLAVLVFVGGNAVAFALELLVTGVQALRLEFYELFSRVFSGQGHPFAPWALPIAEEVP